MSAEPLVSTQIVLPIVDWLREAGVRARPLLERLGVDRDILVDVNELIALRTYVQFFEDAAEAAGNSYFGLDAGGKVDTGSLGALSFLFFSAPTLQDAFRGLNEYLSALQDATDTILTIEDDVARIAYRINDETIAPRRQDTEYSISALFKLMRKYLHNDFSAREITFEHDRVGSHSRYESFFNCDVFFGQPQNSIVFDPHYLTVSAPSISRKLYPIIASHLRDVVATRDKTASLSEQIANMLDGRLLAEGPSVAKIAQKLGVSESTLARRLRAEGTSYNEVLAAKRISVAKRLLLHSDKPIGEIAHSLGYAENASFTRAFKSWCGVSPEQFRLSHTE